MKVTLYTKNTNLRYVPRFMINHTVDVCKALAGDKSDGLGKMVANYLETYSNFAHPCPLQVNTHTNTHLQHLY